MYRKTSEKICCFPHLNVFQQLVFRLRRPLSQQQEIHLFYQLHIFEVRVSEQLLAGKVPQKPAPHVSKTTVTAAANE